MRFDRRGFLLGSAAAVGLAIAPSLAVAESSQTAARRRAVETGARWAARFVGDPEGGLTVAEVMESLRVPGLSFAVIEGGKVDWAGGYGVLEAGGDSRVDEDTPFQAGSIAKPVTSIAALRLRRAGKLDLDRDVTGYLGGYVIPRDPDTGSDPVTVRNLLSHTSGVTPGGYGGYARGAALPTDEQIVRGQPPANSPEVRVAARPNTELAYSGGGYSVVEWALQTITGQPFDALMQQQILTPFGMRQSTFTAPLPTAYAARVARGHRGDGTQVEGGWFVHPEQAAAGLWSTATDLAAFACAVRDAYLGRGSPLTREDAAEFLKIVIEDEGLGVIVIGSGETLEFRHAGGTQGYRAFMTLNVASGQGAVYMANSDAGQTLGFAMLRATSAAYGWPIFRQKEFPRAHLDAAALRPLAGTYAFEGGLKVRVTYDEAATQITAHFPNGDAYPLTPTGPRSFVHAIDAKQIAFEGDGQIQIDDMTGIREAS